MKQILETKDYSKFKVLDGNRAIRDRRVDAIVQSITEVGYVTSPILVNENMEVIDGQGRLAALERLNMPVEYIVHEGIGIEECRQMNIHQSNWTDYDYVQSYAVRGSEDYQRLQSLMDQFKDLPVGIITYSVNGEYLKTPGGDLTRRLRAGKLEVSERDAERAKWELYYASEFKQVAKSIGGAKTPFYRACIYAYVNLDTDGRNKMMEKIRMHALEIPSMTKVEGYLKYFDMFYNEKVNKKSQIHLELQWRTDSI